MSIPNLQMFFSMESICQVVCISLYNPKHNIHAAYWIRYFIFPRNVAFLRILYHYTYYIYSILQTQHWISNELWHSGFLILSLEWEKKTTKTKHKIATTIPKSKWKRRTKKVHINGLHFISARLAYIYNEKKKVENN